MNRIFNFRVLFFVILGFVLTACICNAAAGVGERGLVVKNGKVIKDLPQGERVMMNLDPNTSFVLIDVSQKSVDWSDPDLVTKDEQPIGLAITVIYNRMDNNPLALRQMYTNNPLIATDDAELEKFVNRQISGAAKNATVNFTLSQMLGTQELLEGQLQTIATNMSIPMDKIQNVAGRELFATIIQLKLGQELAQFGISVQDVEITNLQPSETFLDLLEQAGNEKQQQALLREQKKTEEEEAQKELSALENQGEIREQELMNELNASVKQLEIEKANSEVALEIARREAEVQSLLAAVYTQHPEYAHIERVRLIAEALASGNVIYVPIGADLYMFGSDQDGNTTLVPVQDGQ